MLPAQRLEVNIINSRQYFIQKIAKISSTRVASAIEETKTKILLNEIMNLDNTGSSAVLKNKNVCSEVSIINSFKNKKGKNRFRSDRIIGNNSGEVLKAVPKFMDVHVYLLHPETSAEIIKNFLSEKFTEVLCEKLQPKHPERYSSFKVSGEYI